MKDTGMDKSPISKELDLYLRTGRFYDPETDGFGQAESARSSALRTILPKGRNEEAFKNPDECKKTESESEKDTSAVEESASADKAAEANNADSGNSTAPSKAKVRRFTPGVRK